MTDKTARVILSKPSQWDTWLELVKTAAIQKDVWDLINPDALGPVPGPEPEPELPLPADENPEKRHFRDRLSTRRRNRPSSEKT